MSQVLKERLKNIIITVLIVTGIIQVGILFGYQSQGTPFNLLVGFFNRSHQISDTEVRDRLFVPDRLILSDGEKSYWVIDKSDEFYGRLMDEVKKDLVEVASGNTTLRTSGEKWGDLTEKRGFIFDFNYQINQELLTWFLGIDKSSPDFPDIRKIMIKPDIIDDSTCLLYVYSNDAKVYVSDPITFGKAIDIEKIFSSISENNNYRTYNTFRGAKIDTALKAPPDIPFVNSPPKDWAYNEYECSIPDRALNRDELAIVLLGNEKSRYTISTITGNTEQFDDNNNVYKFFPDGFLTYQYLDTVKPSENGNIGDALLIAYKFIDRVNQLFNTSADIMLADIDVDETRPGVFNFYFDYSLDDMPVKIDAEVQDKKTGKLSHAISIQADSKRMLKCEWLLRNFGQSGKNSYNDQFFDLMGLLGRGYDEIQINNAHLGYYIKSTKETKLYPDLLIEIKDGSAISTIPIEMPKAKGD